jgi:ATP-dependent Lon protease
MEKIILHPFLRNQKCSFVIPIQSTQIALQLVRQGLSNEPPRDITIVETTKLEDKNSENSLAEDASVDVNRTESSFENIDVVPLTTISEVDPNEHSNEAPTKTAAEETAKIFSTSSTDEVI